jgi:hypothetical protein
LSLATRKNAMTMKTLKVDLPEQGQDHWCWAAVSIGIAQAYGDTTFETQQCDVASRVLAPLKCCPEGFNDACDVPNPLSSALGSHLSNEFASSATFELVKSSIEDGHPIAVRIGWGDGGAGHFVVISGYYEDGITQDVYVCDPYLGGGGIPYDFEEFRDNWQQQGNWTITFQTTGSQPVPGV